MVPEILYPQSGVLIVAVLMGAIALGTELGYRLGQRGSGEQNDLSRAQIRSVQTAILGLLSLLLGFTFSMAMSRFEVRKQMVVQEVNAIGTAALRSHFLPAGTDEEVNGLFRRYVEVRLESVRTTQQGSEERAGFDHESGRIQQQLWRLANEAAEADPRSVPLGLFVHAVNELIDSKTRRDVAVANHVPESVLVFLLTFAVVVSVILGYGNGLAGRRIRLLTAAHSVIVVCVVAVIIDLDRPQQGFARISQQSMIRLEEDLRAKQR